MGLMYYKYCKEHAYWPTFLAGNYDISDIIDITKVSGIAATKQCQCCGRTDNAVIIDWLRQGLRYRFTSCCFFCKEKVVNHASIKVIVVIVTIEIISKCITDNLAVDM